MKKERLNINQSGFSVVEIIIASAVFALIVTAFTSSLIYFNKSAIATGTRTQAVFLAEEGIEVTRNIRDEDFNNLVDGTHSEDIIDIFTRQVEISIVDADTKQIDSIVSWGNSSVRLITYLTNWQAVVEVTESCSAICQSLSYTDGVCRQNIQRCRNNGEVYEIDGDQYCTEGPQADTCCCEN